MLDESEQIADSITYQRPAGMGVECDRTDGGRRGDLQRGLLAAPGSRAVRFAQEIQSLLEQGYKTFVEVGPHPVLTAWGGNV